MRDQALEGGHPVVQGSRPPGWDPEDVGAVDEALDAKLLRVHLGDAHLTNARERQPEGLAPEAPDAVEIRRDEAGDPLEPPAAPLQQLPFGERRLSRAGGRRACHCRPAEGMVLLRLIRLRGKPADAVQN